MNRSAVMRLVGQRGADDCAVAAVAMIARVPYHEALDVMPRGRGGAETREIVRALHLLGRRVTQRKTFDRKVFDRHGDGLVVTDDHVAVAWNGSIIETDMTIWTIDAWLAIQKPTLYTFLEVR
jgi:hypothetical protein